MTNIHYLVIGATEGFGGYALEFLKKIVPQNEIYVLIRSKEKGGAPKEAGSNARIGDYDDLDSVKEALKGIDRLFFISGVPGNRQAEHKNVVRAARVAGVSYIAYISFVDTDHSISALVPGHQLTEKMIKGLGISRTFLRNNWHVENELPIIGQALEIGQPVYTIKDGKAGQTLKREHAEAAIKVLVESGSPRILELSGNLTDYEELVKALECATGKELEIIEASDAASVENLKEVGLPQEVTDMFSMIQHDIKKDQLVIPSDDLEKIPGKPLTSLGATLKEILDREQHIKGL